jgi:hypothetical protein
LKWWKDSNYFASIENEEEREDLIEKNEKNNMKFIFKFCLKRYPPCFFDILYQNADIFSEDSEADTEFLPYIHFKNLWQCDISEKNRETIWKYLQLILFSIVGSLENKEAFGDSSKLFEAVNQDEFKTKLEETLNSMGDIFKNQTQEQPYNNDTQSQEKFQGMPNADDIHNHINGIMKSKLGDLAKEIAEETAADLNMDMEGATNVQDIFQKLFKNPTKLMNLVQNVGSKLESKMKSGEIKESELVAEATEILNKMKGIPGMGNMQDMLSKLGLSSLAKGGKLNLNAMQTKLDQTMKSAKINERIRQKAQERKFAAANKPPNNHTTCPTLSEQELFDFLETCDKKESTMNNQKTDKKSKKKGNKK